MPRAVMAALRPHQWVKNLLVLLPLFLAHRMLDFSRLQASLWAMASFCCCASAVYVLNDLVDRTADRQHAVKRLRPFAAGELSARTGLAMSALLCCGSLALAGGAVSLRFAGLLGAYVAMTSAYSFYFKKRLLLDVILLAGLYTFRIVAGAEAADVRLSPWLLAFSMFFFLSLAFGKRYIELSRLPQRSAGALPGRSYLSDDAQLLESVGPTSGYLAVLVFCLYIDSDAVSGLYQRAWLLWLICPLLLYWVTRFWLLARRRVVHDDPVVFALKDRASLASIALTALIVLIASS